MTSSCFSLKGIAVQNFQKQLFSGDVYKQINFHLHLALSKFVHDLEAFAINLTVPTEEKSKATNFYVRIRELPP